MDFTANYNLKKPTLSDPSDITELGVNFDTIDAALKGLDTGKGDRTEYRANANLNLLLDDKAYVCGGTMQNVPVPNSYCIVRVYDSESTNRIVQVCYVPQTDNTVRTFVRAAIGNSFGSWRELATNAYVDGKNDTNAMLIEENTFRFKALANSMTKSLTTFFVETFENTDDVNSTKGDGAAVIGSYYNAAAHAIIKGDTGAATFYSAAKIVTTGNNNVWAFWEWQDMGGGSVEVAVSRDNGVTFTAVPNNTLVSISSQPAGASVVYRVAMTGKVKFKKFSVGDEVLVEQYEFDAAVKSVNSEKPDSAGNVKVDTGVTTINGEAPDENGNVNVGGMPVGFEYFQMNPNIPAGSLPLLGGLYSRSTYADLWEWVQAQHGYLKTEGEWQGLAAENGGSVPFYSSGDGSSNFRVPALSCWVKGAEGIEEVGSYLEAGSLDHYHAFGYNTANNSGTFIATNASDEYTFKEGTRGWNGSSGGGGFTPVENKKGNFNMITSYSAGMEGDMRPPSIVGLWLVKALAKIDTTGTATTDQIAENIEELNRTITNNIPSLATGIAKMQSYFQGTFTKTLLWGNEKVWSNANSTINLSQPWRDFDGLQFCMFFDDSAYRPFQAGGQILWKWEFEEAIRLARLNPTGQGRIIRLGFGDGVYIQWRADGNMPSDMALTVSDENCGIGAVYGISLNAKGITNNSAIDVTEIQEKIGGMFTADNHLRLPSGLEVW